MWTRPKSCSTHRLLRLRESEFILNRLCRNNFQTWSIFQQVEMYCIWNVLSLIFFESVKNLHDRWAKDCATFRELYNQLPDLEFKQKIDWGPLLDEKQVRWNPNLLLSFLPYILITIMYASLVLWLTETVRCGAIWPKPGWCGKANCST